MTTFAPIRPRGKPMPLSIAPMLATSACKLPTNQDDFTFEFKWDGIRALTYWDGSLFRITSRNELDITRRYPELAQLADALGDRKAILDGEIVAMDETDRPSFALLQRRMHAEGSAIQVLARELPIYYVIFDLLYVDGKPIMHLPLSQRREILEELTLIGPCWRISPAQVGEGTAMWEMARRHSLEGIVAKRLSSVYEPGRRSRDWLKIKLVQRQEFVVGGWTAERGSPHQLGALHVGYYDPLRTQKLRYVGAVGSGFNVDTRRSLIEQLQGLKSDENPFAERLPKRDVHFVEPRLVVEVEYRRWPVGGRIQHAAYKGVRTDKRAHEVVREDRSCAA